MKNSIFYIFFLFFSFNLVFCQEQEIKDTLFFNNTPQNQTIDFSYYPKTENLVTNSLYIKNNIEERTKTIYSTTNENVIILINDKEAQLELTNFEPNVKFVFSPKKHIKLFKIKDSIGNIVSNIIPSYPWLELISKKINPLKVNVDSIPAIKLEVRNTGSSDLVINSGIKLTDKMGNDRINFLKNRIDSINLKERQGTFLSFELDANKIKKKLVESDTLDLLMTINLVNKDIPTNKFENLIPISVYKQTTNSFLYDKSINNWVIICVVLLTLLLIVFIVYKYLKLNQKNETTNQIIQADYSKLNKTLINNLKDKFLLPELIEVFCGLIFLHNPNLTSEDFEHLINQSTINDKQKEDIIEIYSSKKNIILKSLQQQSDLKDKELEKQFEKSTDTFLENFFKEYASNLNSKNLTWKEQAINIHVESIMSIVNDIKRQNQQFIQIKKYFKNREISEQNINENIITNYNFIDSLLKFDDKILKKAFKDLLENNDKTLKGLIEESNLNSKIIQELLSELRIQDRNKISDKIKELLEEINTQKSQMNSFRPFSVFKKASVDMNSIILKVLDLNWNNLIEYKEALIDELESQSSFKNKVFVKFKLGEITDDDVLDKDQLKKNLLYSLTCIYRINEFIKQPFFKSKFQLVNFPFEEYSKAVDGLLFASAEYFNFSIDRPSLFTEYNKNYHDKNNQDSPLIFRDMNDSDLINFKDNLSKNTIVYLVKLGINGDLSEVYVK